MSLMKEKSHKVYETRKETGRLRVRTMFEGETLAQQQFKDQCDVNMIIAKYKKTGTITHVRNATQGVYTDLTELPSLEEAHKTINAATAAFMEIPASIRQRFGHDPQQMIEFLRDEKNKDEAIKLGLVVPPKAPTPDPVLTELQNLNKNLSAKPKTAKKTEE